MSLTVGSGVAGDGGDMTVAAGATNASSSAGGKVQITSGLSSGTGGSSGAAYLGSASS
ncbi:hypothetical protein PHYPSEUDO_006821, partial [Phytophthora pseudosyringae]